jgi:hypothetical protein
MDDVKSKPQTRPRSSRHMQGQNMVFRIPNYKSKTSLDCGSEQSEKFYHSRRSHRKSRAGCVNCKQRRVKVLRTPPIINHQLNNDQSSVMKQNPIACDVKNMASSATIRASQLNLKRPIASSPSPSTPTLT